MDANDRRVYWSLVRAPATAEGLMHRLGLSETAVCTALERLKASGCVQWLAASHDPETGKTTVTWGTVEPEVPEDLRGLGSSSFSSS